MNALDLSRSRQTKALRDQVSETSLSVSNFILPYFVTEGAGRKNAIGSMPGIYHFSIDTLLKDLEEAQATGIRSILLFGLAGEKNEEASGAYDPKAPLQKAVTAIKKEFEDLVVYTDVCMCAFTAHGHCGIIDNAKGIINHKKSAALLAKIALSHAEAGANFVSPSAMMDGQVKAIRDLLNKNGFQKTQIMAYAAKYASSFYSPFRDALDSTPQFGDRKTYQMDYRNSEEALREIEQDIQEGANIVMVKPALSYLDIIAKAKEKFNFPTAAYNVSGEYSFIKNASAGNPDAERELALEVLYSIKRAGADLIISYFGKQIKRWLE